MTVNEAASSQTAGLEDFMNRGIKEIITERPGIEAILDDYDIGCGPCMVGTCLMKDIVEIHALSPSDEREMMGRIVQAIHPDSPIEVPPIQRKTATRKAVTYSPPMQKLVDEHKLIKRLIAQIPRIIEAIDLETEEGRQRVLDGIDFIRNYADSYHHAKEEDLLFKYFDEDTEIIKVMHEDHRNARSRVKNIVEAVESRNRGAVIENLGAYRELLTDHIRREDDILYPWMDRNISTSQVGKLFSSFSEVDERFGDAPERYEKFVRELEEGFQTQEK
ncbi:MAG: hemerythrin domain-containing protein [Candidatus Bathyarchaeia archaeon]